MSSNRNHSRRGLRLESLENRMLLASDSFHNFLSPHDVNDDRNVTAADALVVINHLNRDGSLDDSNFVDVNDDGRASAQDALNVINAINIERSQSRSTDDAIAQLTRNDGARVKFEYEVEDSQAKLEIKVQNASANTDYAVLIDGVMVGTMTTNSRGRGELEFGSGRGAQPLPSNLPVIHNDTMAEIVGLGGSSFTSGSSSSSSDHNSSSSSNSNSNVEDNPSRSSDDNSPSRSNSSSGVEDNPLRSNDDNSSSTSNSSSDTLTSPSVGSTLELKASLTGIASIDGRASFERTSTSLEFKVELRDAPANKSYEVMVGGVSVGTLRTDSRGRGKLAFESGDNSKPFPTEFPAIGVGTTIKVGNELVGTFRRDSN